jgi:hypothetical protein
MSTWNAVGERIKLVLMCAGGNREGTHHKRQVQHAIDKTDVEVPKNTDVSVNIAWISHGDVPDRFCEHIDEGATEIDFEQRQ